MRLRCTITDSSKNDKEILYSFDYDVPFIKEEKLSKKYIPSIIYYTIEYILDSPIPEQLDKYDWNTLTFTTQSKDVLISFDLKGIVK